MFCFKNNKNTYRPYTSEVFKKFEAFMALFRSQSFLSCFDLYLVLLYSIDNKFEFTTESLRCLKAKEIL